jgi:hypothetical protein
MAETEVGIQPDGVAGALTWEPNPTEAAQAHILVANALQKCTGSIIALIIKVTLKLSIYALIIF